MRLVKKMFFEIIFSSIALLFLDSLLTALLFFSLFYFVFTFFRIDILFAALISTVFFLISFIKKIRQNKIMVLEKRYPQLEEKLRTSYDCSSDDNPVALALHTDVINLVTNADINAFLNSKKLLIKVSGVSVLLFLTIVISAYGFDVFRITERIGIPIQPVVNRIKDIAVDISNRVPLRQTTEYMENGKVAQLGDQELNITIDTYNTDIDINEINEPEKNDFGGSFPAEVGGYAQESYEEDISTEHREVIKDYFKRISR
ncbi:hypothetical protein JW930_07520 [Candidatus Woesearchaeota archaeon]|nr:hypothetical protein [Candidatus Woesearchaeota archaeon]